MAKNGSNKSADRLEPFNKKHRLIPDGQPRTAEITRRQLTDESGGSPRAYFNTKKNTVERIVPLTQEAREYLQLLTKINKNLFEQERLNELAHTLPKQDVEALASFIGRVAEHKQNLDWNEATRPSNAAIHNLHMLIKQFGIKSLTS